MLTSNAKKKGDPSATKKGRKERGRGGKSRNIAIPATSPAKNQN
jgi:hypothetical protein